MEQVIKLMFEAHLLSFDLNLKERDLMDDYSFENRFFI